MSSTLFKVMINSEGHESEIGQFYHRDAACFFRDKLGKALGMRRIKTGGRAELTVWRTDAIPVEIYVIKSEPVSMLDELVDLLMKVELR